MAKAITEEEAKVYLRETPEAQASIAASYKLRKEKQDRIKEELLKAGMSEETASSLSKLC